MSGHPSQARLAGGALGGLTWYARKAPSFPPCASMNFTRSMTLRWRAVSGMTLAVRFFVMFFILRRPGFAALVRVVTFG